jgi:hypothetical protein
LGSRGDYNQCSWVSIFTTFIEKKILINSISIWYSLVFALTRHLSPPSQSRNGVSEVIYQWVEPGSASTASSSPAWLPDFTKDITPVPCHSHNDYWRTTPLYDALLAGCTSVEADVWLEDNELYVGHSHRSLRKSRTFKSLYVDPISSILENQNSKSELTTANEGIQGVFDTSPNTTLILLVDFKTDGHDLFPVVEAQLDSLRQKGYLTRFNGTHFIPGAVTVVGTGNTQFSDITSSTNRTIFFDAPLEQLSGSPQYTPENSYYASVSMTKAVGHLWFNKFSAKQKETIKAQIDEATKRGLVSRYWSAPAWPVGWRIRVWEFLTEMGVGMLNVDELQEASRWSWRGCVVMGIGLC